MLVRALELGYIYHRRRREGEVFKLKNEKDFSSRWMEKVESGSAKKAAEVVETKPVAKKVRPKKTPATVFNDKIEEELDEELDDESEEDEVI